MNLPNKLTVIRMFAIPVFMVFTLVPFTFGFDGDFVCRCIAAFLFLGAAITDKLDGSIARKYGLVTTFGKFMDPLADKLMVLGALIGLTVMSARDTSFGGELYFRLTATLCFLVLFRELSVTSLRLAASDAKNVVIAASVLGKIKTVTQIVYVMVALLEPVVFGPHLIGKWIPFFAVLPKYHILSYLSMFLVAVITVWSGLNYLKAYFPLINSNK